MVYNSLDRKTAINGEKLDANQYTISLMEEAFHIGLIKKEQIENVQMQVIYILKDLIKRYTKGESSSVTVETAEKILNSIYYSIDAYISSFDYPEDGINALKTKTIKEIYENGIEIVTENVLEAMMLLNEVKKNKLNIPSEVYNDTIEKGLPKFFDNYAVVFNAHEGDCDIDYPLVYDEMKLIGVAYIKDYLSKLSMENEFCNLFKQEDINELLINYGRICKVDIVKFPINIFEIVINNSIFSVLLGNNADAIIISKFQRDILIKMLKSIDSSQISSVIYRAAEKITTSKKISDNKLIEYIDNYIPIIISRLLNAAENDSLSNIIVTSEEEKFQDINIIFEKGRKMKDDEFRIIINEIMECEKIDDKLTIIHESIKSIEDFIDMLKTDCLFGNEMKTVFEILSDIELSVLGKVVFCEEMRNGIINLSKISMSDKEEEWQREYVGFIKELCNERKDLIETYINTVES